MFAQIDVARAALEEEDKAQTGRIITSKIFDKQMVFSDENYVLHDVLEFSVFDISEVSINDDTDIKNKELIESQLGEVPRYFYKALKKEIHLQQVPVTLYPKDSPSYTKPIKFAVKLKKIQIKTQSINETGERVAVLQMQIYGQIKDKKTEMVLTRFYDSDSVELVLGQSSDAMNQALNDVSSKLMRDVSLFLKSQY